MKQVMNSSVKKQGDNEKSAILRLEMDYELATLFEAMSQDNKEMMKDCKQKLEKIRQELMHLKAL